MSLPTDVSACRLAAGAMEATFLPGQGMLGVSLKHAGVELLRQVDDLGESARRKALAGLPLLHPWANRLSTPRYSAAGKRAVLDPGSRWLSLDENGLPNHGVAWSLLAWQLTACSPDRLQARLHWEGAELLSLFPFRHALAMQAALDPDALTVTTTLEAYEATPVSFGFHPYFGIPGLARERWRLRLPAMRRMVLNDRRLPIGIDEQAAACDEELGSRALDQGFATPDPNASIVLSGGALSIALELLGGYRYLQIYAPAQEAFVCIEPMTAPANALVSGNGLTVVPAGERYRAAFRIRVSVIES